MGRTALIGSRAGGHLRKQGPLDKEGSGHRTVVAEGEPQFSFLPLFQFPLRRL